MNTYNYDGNEYVDEENTEVARGFNTYDTKINYSPTRKLTLEMGVRNIFDEQREALADQVFTEDNTVRSQDKRPLVGRYFYLGFTLRG